MLSMNRPNDPSLVAPSWSERNVMPSLVNCSMSITLSHETPACLATVFEYSKSRQHLKHIVVRQMSPCELRHLAHGSVSCKSVSQAKGCETAQTCWTVSPSLSVSCGGSEQAHAPELNGQSVLQAIEELLRVECVSHSSEGHAVRLAPLDALTSEATVLALTH